MNGFCRFILLVTDVQQATSDSNGTFYFVRCATYDTIGK